MICCEDSNPIPLHAHAASAIDDLLPQMMTRWPDLWMLIKLLERMEGLCTVQGTVQGLSMNTIIVAISIKLAMMCVVLHSFSAPA